MSSARHYRLNRADFAAVAALADKGELDSAEYYGDLLPLGLRHLSVVDGRAARIAPLPGASQPVGHTVVFLPASTGIPDGAIGFAYLDGVPTGPYDCFADPCRARWSLGDGWYWMG